MMGVLLIVTVGVMSLLLVALQRKKDEVQAFEQEAWRLQDELGMAMARYRDAEQVLGIYKMTPDEEKSAVERVIDRVTADLIPWNKHQLDISDEELILDGYARDVLDALDNE